MRERRNRHETIDITNKDLSNRHEIKKATDLYFNNRAGLLLPQEYLEYCAGCTRPTYNLKKEEYYGEMFCTDCVTKWKAGY